MTEEQLMSTAEYGAMLRAPVSDKPRLAVAHAIKEVWPLRAEFIETQIAGRAAKRASGAKTPEWGALLKRSTALADKLAIYDRAKELVAAHRARSPYIQRGFVHSIEVDVADFIEVGADLLASFPLLSVVLEGSSARIDALAECEALGRLTSLGFRCPDLGDDGIRRLVMSPHLDNLRHLWTQGSGLGRRGYEHVIEATQATLASLEMFDSDDNAIDHPQERQPSYDSISGYPVYETVGILPEEGRALEAKYGYQKVLHWCSRFGPELEKWPYE